MLELYHWEPNTCFLKPLIALEEKRVPFQSRWFDPTSFEQLAPEFPADTESRLQLEREGPLLVHDGTLVSGSFFMLEYIAEAFPGTQLYPGDAYQHYRARAWGQVLAAIGADVGILGCAKYLRPILERYERRWLESYLKRIEPVERRTAWEALLDGRYDERALEAIRERLAFSLQRVEKTLAHSRWLAGADYSVADIDAFAVIAPLPELAPAVLNASATPRIAEFLVRMYERPAVQRALGYTRSGRPERAFVPGAEPSRWG
ncbi:MAG TPA: glutathione S-transferase family protein [Steroidobacteraceae bacterium]|nr:glutathione S-transferase family protein [Steroidobacteraceae bacterium]